MPCNRIAYEREHRQELSMLERELSRISQISSTGRRVENLAYLLNTDLLRQCFKELDPNKASGIDEVTKGTMHSISKGILNSWLPS